MAWTEIRPQELKENPFEMIGSRWLLVAAGKEDSCNMLTASWGAVGVIWRHPSLTLYIRQSRYTKEFIDREEYFTVSVFGEDYRQMLNRCGSISGRDTDKIAESGLHVCKMGDSVAFEEAQMVFVCRKQFHQLMDPENFDVHENKDLFYKDGDLHVMYIGSIEKIYVKEPKK